VGADLHLSIDLPIYFYLYSILPLRYFGSAPRRLRAPRRPLSGIKPKKKTPRCLSTWVGADLYLSIVLPKHLCPIYLCIDVRYKAEEENVPLPEEHIQQIFINRSIHLYIYIYGIYDPFPAMFRVSPSGGRGASRRTVQSRKIKRPAS